MSRRILPLCLALLTAALCAPAPAQIYISGPQSGVLVDTTYFVTGNISVSAGDSLIIQAGAEFLFNYSTAFDIYGWLWAVGSRTDSIRFEKNVGVPYWDGIDFNNSSSDSSRLEYAFVSGSNYSGIRCEYSSPTISRCTITKNYSVLHGGGIDLVFSSAIIDRCVITEDSCWDWGAGICGSLTCSPIISNCVISRNKGWNASNPSESIGGAIYFTSWGRPIIRNCLIFQNECGNHAAAIEAINAIIENCTIVRNIARGHWGTSAGYAVFVGTGATITNCIIRYNYRRQINAVHATYCDIEGGWPGLGNIDEDPLFVSGPEGDYYLSQIAAGQTQQSPCVDAGDPAAPMIIGTTRTDGVQDAGIVDMGFHHPLPANASITASSREEGPFRAYDLELRTSCFPNPFNASTVASFELRAASFVSLRVYDTAGRLAADLVNGWREAGNHEITFDGSRLPSGIYIARLQAGSFHAAQKLVLMK